MDSQPDPSMSSASAGAEPGAPFPTPPPTLLYGLVALVVFGVGTSAWSPVPAGVWHDDGVYMLIGKAIAGGHGLVYDGVVGAPPAAKFPPLYPSLLAILWTVLGGIGAVTLAAAFLNLVFVGVAAGLMARALREGAGLSLRVAALLAALAYCSADVLRTALVPLSESAFLAIAAAAFALWPSSEREEGSGARLALAVTLVAAVATRSAGLALVAAFGVATWRRRGIASAAAVAGPGLAVAIAWALWSGSAAARIPEGARDLLGPYGGWLAAQAVAGPVTFLAGLPAHASAVLGRVAALAVPGASGWLLAAVGVPAAALALLGLRRAFVRFPPMAWFALAYLGMLLVWPYADRRLVVPLHPVAIALLALGVEELLGRLTAARLRTALSAVAYLWVAAYCLVTASRIADDWPVQAYRLRSDRLAAAVEALGQTAPETAVVGAAEYWAALHLHGGWTVSPSVRFDPRSADPEAPVWGTPEEQIALWSSLGIDHLLLELGGTLHGAALDRLEEQCPGRVVVLARSPPLIVVRIDWAACG